MLNIQFSNRKLEKEPENFNEQDLIAIMQYEEAVKFHQSERERYHKMLTEEYDKMSAEIQGDIGKFDEDLSDLLTLKLDVEASMNHEILKMLRLMQRCYKVARLEVQERDIKAKTLEREAEALAATHLAEQIKTEFQELKTSHDNLIAKDKRAEKQMRTDLRKTSTTPSTIDYLIKVFKRRPKVEQHSLPSSSLYEEVANCVSNYDRELRKRLPQEYIEFLETLDQFDSSRASIQANVDPAIWNLVITARRKKIELEFKIRASEIELKEAEKSLVKFAADLVNETKIFDREAASERILALRDKVSKLQHDFEIQLVYKQGQVELNVSGRKNDFNDCILINQSVIEQVNSLVKKAGAKKIEAMLACANFHRKIIVREWEHKKHKMLMEDLQEKMIQLDQTKLTTEVRVYLNHISIYGEPTEKDIIQVSPSNELKMLDLHRKKAMEEMVVQLRAVESKYSKAMKENKRLDKAIEELNCQTSSLHYLRNTEFERTEKEDNKKRMDTIVKRTKLIKHIQEIHCEIIQLQTELELLRLRTYPTLRYKALF